MRRCCFSSRAWRPSSSSIVLRGPIEACALLSSNKRKPGGVGRKDDEARRGQEEINGREERRVGEDTCI
jgi:hypothetical protein